MKQMWWRLSLFGLIGAASLLLAPLEQFIPADFEPMLVRLLAIVQPAVLVLIFTGLGVWAAPHVGLDAPVFRAWAEGGSLSAALRRQLPAALWSGVAVAIILVLFWLIMASQTVAGPLANFKLPLLTKLLYGGIVEELLLRWGLMSFLAWLAWRLMGTARPIPAYCYWAAILVSACLFAAGHLPVLFLVLPDAPAWLVAVTLIANALPGLLFGWLFWRGGLEGAMIAHASGHLFATIALAMLG